MIKNIKNGFKGAILISLCFSTFAWSQVEPVRSLSIDEATALSLNQSFDIQIAKFNALIARTGKDVSTSIYDTLLSAQAAYENNQLKQTSAMLGTKTTSNLQAIGISQKTPFGSTVSVDMDHARVWTNASTVTSPLSHESSVGLTVAQDLGRNFLGVQDRGDIKISLIDVSNADYIALDRIELDVSAVQKAYWDLVLAIEREKIQQDMVSQAKKLYDLHQEKLKDGLVEIPEAIASEANYKDREKGLQLVQNQVRNAENTLRLLLNINEGTMIIPEEKLVVDDKPLDLDGVLVQAFDNRRDYKVVRQIIEAKNIKLSMKKQSLWPEVNLTATFKRNGIDDQFDRSTENITAEDNPDFSAMLTFEFPFANTKAKAQYKAMEYEKAQAVLTMKWLERQIIIGLNNKVRDCQVFKKSAGMAVEVSDLQKQKLDEEEKRFNQGRSTTDILIRYQEDLIIARDAAAQEKYKYIIAMIDLDVAKGMLLKKYWNEQF